MQVYHPERNELRLLAWRGFHPESAAYWHWVSLDHHSTCAAALSAGRRVIVPDLETCAEMAGTRDLDEYRRSGIRSVQSTPLLSRSGDLIGMISTHWREAHLPGERALRRLDVLARQAADLIERSKVEARLREHEHENRWFASIVNLTDDAIISTDLEGRILSWNRGAEKVFGYTADEVVGSPSFLVPPELNDEYRNVIERIRAGEPFVRYETIRLCKDGSRITASLTVSPVKDVDDKTVGLSAIVRDITEQRRQEDQISVLAREAEHRTANVLSAVQAAISLTDADSAENFKHAVAGRVQALATVHRLFVESRWTGADLLEVTTQELAPFCDDSGIRVRLDGPKISVRPCIAQGIAVILHELATNAAKYGSLSFPDGRLVVNWSVAEDGRVMMRWIESNGPVVCRPEHSGFGMRVLEKITASLLQGECRLDWRTEGLACDLKFCP